MKRRTKSRILVVVLLVAASALLLYQQVMPTARSGPSGGTSTKNTVPDDKNGSSTSSLTESNVLATMARYTIDSPPTGQWMVIQATSPVLSISASNSGTIPAYSSLASLNQTTIGYECSRRASNGSCDSYEYVQQTGWFWDSTGRTLTVHYLGGTNVTLTVVEQP